MIENGWNSVKHCNLIMWFRWKAVQCFILTILAHSWLFFHHSGSIKVIAPNWFIPNPMLQVSHVFQIEVMWHLLDGKWFMSYSLLKVMWALQCEIPCLLQISLSRKSRRRFAALSSFLLRSRRCRKLAPFNMHTFLEAEFFEIILLLLNINLREGAMLVILNTLHFS